MKLLTKSLERKLPTLYSTEKQEDPTVYAKFFTPDSNYTWYVLEFDRAGGDMFFGLVKGQFEELGYFSLSELGSLRGPWGLKVERDLHFAPRPLSEVR